jgi:hypothetical protein
MAAESLADDAFDSMADTYDLAAGRAFLAGDYDKALLFVAVARNLDPDRAGLWAERELRIKAAETQRYPLAELMERRIARLGRGKDDPAVRQWAEHNASLHDREMEV